MELTLEQALQKGVEAHKNGNIQEADRCYTAILNVQPKHPDANHNMGVLAVGVGKVREAIPFFETALEANSQIGQFWLSYIDTLIKLNRMADAKSMLKQAIRNGLKDDGFDQLKQKLLKIEENNQNQADNKLVSEAIELRESGKFDQAIDHLKTGLTNYPSDANLHNLLCHCYILTQNLENAIIHLETAKKFAPESALVRWNEIRLLMHQKKFDHALTLAQKTHEQFPADIEGLVILGSCLRMIGDLNESLKYLSRAIKLNSNNAEALINRGLIWLKQEEKSQALIDLEKAYKLKPHIKQIWHLVISLKMEKKEFEETIVLSEEMAKIDPLDEKIINSIGVCHKNLKNFDKALVAFRKTISIKPDHIEGFFNLASTLIEQGNLEHAKDAYEEALSIKPDMAGAYNNIANIFDKQFKLEEAVETYKKAISIDPDYAEAYNNMGNTLREQGNLEEAISAYKKALSIKPDMPGAHNNMGVTFRKLKKLELAIEAFDKVNAQQATAQALECLYELENYTEFNKRLSLVANADTSNIRVAAISSFAAQQLGQQDIYPFCKNPLNMVSISNIKNYISNDEVYLKDLLNEMNKLNAKWEPGGNTTKGGFQTGSQLFSEGGEHVKILEDLIKKELEAYRQKFSHYQSELIQNWPDKTRLSAWYVRLLQGGHQDSHIHPSGWVSGVIYLKTIPSPKNHEGAIKFGLHGYNYPVKDKKYPTMTHQPLNGDLVLFPSSLFHETIPVSQKVERCVIAFDLVKA